MPTWARDRPTSRVSQTAPGPQPPEAPSRTGYEHLGGAIGVGIYSALRERDALRARPDGVVELGPQAAESLAALGVDIDAVKPGRQRSRSSASTRPSVRRR